MTDPLRLLSDYFDGSLDDDQHRRLVVWLRESPENMAEFARWSLRDCQIRRVMKEPDLLAGRAGRAGRRSAGWRGRVIDGPVAALANRRALVRITAAGAVASILSFGLTLAHRPVASAPSPPPRLTLVSEVEPSAPERLAGSRPPATASNPMQINITAPAVVHLNGPIRLERRGSESDRGIHRIEGSPGLGRGGDRLVSWDLPASPAASPPGARVLLGPLGEPTTIGALRDGGFDAGVDPPAAWDAIAQRRTPWVAVATTPVVRIYRRGGAIKPHTPPGFAQFTGEPHGGAGIMQAVRTEPGAVYELAYFLARTAAAAAPSLEVDVSRGVVHQLAEVGDLAHQRTVINWPQGQWRRQSVRFTAASNVTTIGFLEPLDSDSAHVAPALDSVSLARLSGVAATP